MYFGLIVPAYSYAYFAPSIIQSFGYGPISTQLHSVPPWACAFGFAMILAFASDRMRHRWAFSVIPAVVCIAGFAILSSFPKSTNVRYGALFLVTSGQCACLVD
jgi:peptidoglycan/LPS O-acetylase OafA/YrhL